MKDIISKAFIDLLTLENDTEECKGEINILLQLKTLAKFSKVSQSYFLMVGL